MSTAPLRVADYVYDAALDPDARPRRTRSWVTEDKDPDLNPDLNPGDTRLALARSRPALRRVASLPRSGIAAEERRASLGLSGADSPAAPSCGFPSPPQRVVQCKQDSQASSDLCKRAAQEGTAVEDAPTGSAMPIDEANANVVEEATSLLAGTRSLNDGAEVKGASVAVFASTVEVLKGKPATSDDALDLTPELRSESVAIADWPLVAAAKALWQAKAASEAPQPVAPTRPPVPLKRKSVSFSRVESYTWRAPNETGQRVEDGGLAALAANMTGTVEAAVPRPILKSTCDDPASPCSVLEEELASTGRSSTSTTSPRLGPSREAATRQNTVPPPHRLAKPLPPPVPSPHPLLHQHELSLPLPPPLPQHEARAMRGDVYVCSPLLGQPSALLEQQHMMVTPRTGDLVHHPPKAPQHPLLEHAPSRPASNPLALATPRPLALVRRPAGLLALVLMLLGARCALRPVAAVLSITPASPSQLKPKDSGMSVDPTQLTERAKALEAALLERANSMNKEQDAFFHTLQVERAALQAEREELRQHLAQLKAGTLTSQHSAPKTEAISTPLPPHKILHNSALWLRTGLAKLQLKSKLWAAARSAQTLTRWWTVAAAGWNFVG